MPGGSLRFSYHDREAGVSIRGERFNSWHELAARLDAEGSARSAGVITPFQATCWLPAWYEAFGKREDVEALPIGMIDEQTDKLVCGWPLVRRLSGDGRTVIEFADLDITDYNAPLLAEGCNVAVGDLFKALISALPRADVLRLEKMPNGFVNSGGIPCAIAGLRPSPFGANGVRIEGDWEQYRHNVFTRKFRRELERSFRVFERDGVNARFEMLSDYDGAVDVLRQMETIQEARIAELGLPFRLNDTVYRDFYRSLIGRGLEDGSVVVTALRTEAAKVVAGLIGIRKGDDYAFVRLAQDLSTWSHCSPGKLVIERTMHMLYRDGVRHFDFTTGDYPYKEGFGVEREALWELHLPLSMRGRVTARREKVVEDLKAQLRRYPKIYLSIKGLVGL
jgi:CelD/BcsL family acetyltransferase involved in cellulose biosynthesis